ncbi:MAG: methyltransferase domain-containing protein, partial [Gammaproteobacteria bacterium]
MNCRHCGTKLFRTFIDLGSAPPSNAYLTNQAVSESEKWYPLKVLVCDSCWLVQTEDFVAAAELFSEEYAYFSSYSRLWVDHAKAYADLITTRLQLTNKSLVVEIAANDGYLLQNFKKNGIPCYGVEPTARTAATAMKKGIPIIQDFFGVALARKLQTDKQRANLIVANNVLAHVPDINDFVSGIPVLLAENGTATFEFPHLLKLVENNQFDTIYHEHFSYLSLTTVNIIFNAHGLTIYDVEEIPTHGGSLRLYA